MMMALRSLRVQCFVGLELGRDHLPHVALAAQQVSEDKGTESR